MSEIEQGGTLEPQNTNEQETPVEETQVVAETPVVEETKPVTESKPVEKAPVKPAPVAEVVVPEGLTIHSVNQEKDKVRGRRKVRQGRVVSGKMDKTVVVAIERKLRHPLYGKIMRRTERFKAHDETNECTVGDLVQIMETRPISREKRWRVVRVVEKAK